MGPKFGRLMFEILLQFHVEHIANTGDIEETFLLVSVKKEDCDSLHFLWVSDPDE